MAGRFVFQKLASSGISRSASRLVGAPASALSRATAPVIPEHGIRNLSKFFHDAAAAVRPAGLVVGPSISNHGGIRGYRTAKYLNTLPCLPPRVPAKIRRLKSRMPPGINNHNKSSALVDSVGEVKPTTSSPDASNQLKLVDGPATLVAWASKKVKGMHRHDIFLLKFFVTGSLMAATLVVIACHEDVNNSSSMVVPSQSLHRSDCSCRSPSSR